VNTKKKIAYRPIELPDPDPPEQEADDRGERCGERVRGRGAEGVLDELRGRARQVQVVDDVVREDVCVAAGRVDDRDEDEHRRQHRQRRVDGDGAARVATRREVGAEPLECEPADRRVRAALEPPLDRLGPVASDDVLGPCGVPGHQARG
jgi:hypothetical protein